MEIILHLLHRLQNWPGSAISYKDSAYILQLEFSFIPWLFHAWTIAIMFVPSYFFFFLTTHYKAIQSFRACFVSHWSILAVHILFSSLLSSYMCSVTYEIKSGSSIYHCNHSRTSKTADSNFLSILQSICWVCITAATQIIHLSFACLKYMHFTCLKNFKYFVLLLISVPRDQLNWQLFCCTLAHSQSFETVHWLL